MGVSAVLRPSATGSAVRHPVLLDVVAIGLEQRIRPAQLANLLLGSLDHPVTLARMGRHHLAGTGNLEALFSARLGLDLGHLALLYGRKREPKARFTGKMLEMSVCMRHVSSPRQPFSRAAEGAVYGRRNREKQQSGWPFCRTGGGSSAFSPTGGPKKPFTIRWDPWGCGGWHARSGTGYSPKRLYG